MALGAQFIIKSAGDNLQPHLIVYYLRDMAQSFHQFYNNVNILNAEELEQNNILRALMIVKSVIAFLLVDHTVGLITTIDSRTNTELTEH